MPETTPRKANTTGTATTPHAMRRARREVTDPAALRAIFEQAHVVRIGATDAEGMFVVPMNYGMEWGEGDAGGSDAGAVAATPPACTLWLHCAAEGRKVDAWRAEPHVAFELDVELGVIEGSICGGLDLDLVDMEGVHCDEPDRTRAPIPSPMRASWAKASCARQRPEARSCAGSRQSWSTWRRERP